MQLSLSRTELALYVRKQFEHLFPDTADLVDLPHLVDVALGRLEHCFSRIRLKGYFGNGEPRLPLLRVLQTQAVIEQEHSRDRQVEFASRRR